MQYQWAGVACVCSLHRHATGLHSNQDLQEWTGAGSAARDIRCQRSMLAHLRMQDREARSFWMDGAFSDKGLDVFLGHIGCLEGDVVGVHEHIVEWLVPAGARCTEMGGTNFQVGSFPGQAAAEA